MQDDRARLAPDIRKALEAHDADTLRRVRRRMHALHAQAPGDGGVVRVPAYTFGILSVPLIIALPLAA